MAAARITKAMMVESSGSPVDLRPMIEVHRKGQRLAIITCTRTDVAYTNVPVTTIKAATSAFRADSVVLINDVWIKTYPLTDGKLPEGFEPPVQGQLAQEYAEAPDSGVRQALSVVEVPRRGALDHRAVAYGYDSGAEGLTLTWNEEGLPTGPDTKVVGEWGVSAVRQGYTDKMPRSLRRALRDDKHGTSRHAAAIALSQRFGAAVEVLMPSGEYVRVTPDDLGLDHV